MTTHIEAEIATQPRNWLDAREVAAAHQALLPRPGEHVAVVGCGTSYYMAQAYAALREAAGLGVTDAWTPTEARLDAATTASWRSPGPAPRPRCVDLLAAISGRIPAR